MGVARTLTGGPSSRPGHGATDPRRARPRDRMPMAPRGHTLAVPRRLSAVVLAHIGGPVGFPGSRPVRGVGRRAASLAIASASCCRCRAWRHPLDRGHADHRRHPARLDGPGRPVRRRDGRGSWCSTRRALTPDGDSGPSAWTPRPDVPRREGPRPGRRQRHRPTRARRARSRSTARFQWAMQGFAARLTSGQVAALRHDPAVARVVPDSSRSRSSADTWPSGRPARQRSGAVRRAAARHGHRHRGHRHRHRTRRRSHRRECRAERRRAARTAVPAATAARPMATVTAPTSRAPSALVTTASASSAWPREPASGPCASSTRPGAAPPPPSSVASTG